VFEEPNHSARFRALSIASSGPTETSVSEHDKLDRDVSQTPNREILLALIKYGSRPAATMFVGIIVFLWLFFIRKPLLQMFNTAEDIKIGSFEVRLRVGAENNDLGSQLLALQNLTDDQLELFLIAGRKREHVTYIGPEATEENFRALQKVGLLSQVNKNASGTYDWTVSDKGFELDGLIFKLLTAALKKSGVTAAATTGLGG
jgi:hypothetical protein